MSDLREKIIERCASSATTLEDGTVFRGAILIYPDEFEALLALLPPAPDGATEGWRLEAKVAWLEGLLHGRDKFLAERGLFSEFVDQLTCPPDPPHPDDVTAPSVSPVGPKGEEEEGLMASRDHAPTVSAVRVAAHPEGNLVQRLEAWMEALDVTWLGLASRDPDATTLDDCIEALGILNAMVRQSGDAGNIMGDRIVHLENALEDIAKSRGPITSGSIGPLWSAGACWGLAVNADKAAAALTENTEAGVSSWRHGKPPSGAPSEQNPSSQPTQTGEENAGLVEEAREHLEWWWGGRDDEPPNNLTSDEIIRRLADALASRSPIPGELKALSEAATAGKLCVEDPFANETDGDLSLVQDGLETYEWQFLAHLPYGPPDQGSIARPQVEANAAFIVACWNHVRQALAKTHKVAEGGEGG